MAFACLPHWLVCQFESTTQTSFTIVMAPGELMSFVKLDELLGTDDIPLHSFSLLRLVLCLALASHASTQESRTRHPRTRHTRQRHPP